MIRTSRQLKALVRNVSRGDSAKAQIIIRNYVMERFLERLSLSQYKSNIILKGGTLVAAIVGLDNRSTLDVDATLKNLPLNEEKARKMVEDIISVPVDDGMIFEIKNVVPIIDEADYLGIRIMLETTLENMRTPLKIDFSTGDVITPREVSYSFRLLFEER
ncbi:MAG TPA: nucleotidyl transferase AbiEii/AbiGii toxin family protein, partial [Firmicutes bacterium]|nr:nucleotidyl transferase AbiEii/AbiGii toxin family protein [Bacillota bacterium]